MNDKKNERSGPDICPLLSVGKDDLVACAEERCAWYEPCSRSCAVLDIAYSVDAVKDRIN